MMNAPNDKPPFVSIITVVYNSAALIEGTIKSIIGQTVRDYEYIIIDGGSTDGTLEVIDRYRSHIDVLVSEKDKGIYDAMNKGLHLAKGTFIWFVNSGDSIAAPDLLSHMISVAGGHDTLYGEALLVDDRQVVLGKRSDLTTRKLPRDLSWRDMIDGMVVSHQAILFKRELVSDYDLSYRCSADIDWVIKGLKKASSISFIDRPVCRYLVGGYSISNQKRCWKERFAIYVHHYGYMRTLLSHLAIVYRNLLFMIKGKKNY